jgi:TPR repeat protein
MTPMRPKSRPMLPLLRRRPREGADPAQLPRRPRDASRLFFVAGIVLAVAVTATPAAAQNYLLTGRYECLATTDGPCYDTTPSGPGPFSNATPEAMPNVGGAAVEAGLGTPPEPPPVPFKKPKKPLAPPVDAIAAMTPRILAGKPDPGDIPELRAHARTGDAHALEMLAWCLMGGVGVTADPVQAYLLYGEAAKAGAAEARNTQSYIFKRRLTSEQRQQVLELENGQTLHAVKG